LLVLAALAAILIGWAFVKKSAPPKIPFAKAARESLVSTLTTNGTVEPVEWVVVHAERAGLIEKVDVAEGRRVANGAPLAELDSRDARADLAAAEAREAQAKASLETIEQGGKPADLAEIDGQLARFRVDLAAAGKDYGALQRLAAKQAATAQQVSDADTRVQVLKVQISSLEKKRADLVSRQDRSVAQANLQDARAAESLARERLQQSVIHAPIAGAVYHLAARLGGYLNAGDEVASVGELKQMRVTLNVDEPELGRVAKGMPVTLTWDALPGRTWQGVVGRAPTEVVPLGTRQVGKVICIVENPNLDLLPGTNVNAAIQSKVVPNALAVPKEALRTVDNQLGVFLLEGDHVIWRNIAPGASTVVKVQVLSGLAEGDSVALATDYPLKDGSRVKPYYPVI
jgi:HlyD family secretion protein